MEQAEAIDSGPVETIGGTEPTLFTSAPEVSAPMESASMDPASMSEFGSESDIGVIRGDTLSKIALARKPDGVTLEQMLVVLFKNNPHLDEIFVVKDPALFSSLKLLPTLRKRAFDTAYIFHLSQRPILPIVSLAGPSKIIGTEGINKGLDHLLTTPLKQAHLHEIERRLNIVDCKNDCPKMEIFLTEEENNASFEHLVESPLMVGIHPGAKDRFKQWNPKHFIEIGRKLVQDKGATVLITGDASEVELYNRTFLGFVNALIEWYRDTFHVFAHDEPTLFKLLWDALHYFSFPGRALLHGVLDSRENLEAYWSKHAVPFGR